MILLDLDNLNILVLFILAFISFKSYQADHHQIDSQSDSELSEVQDIQPKVDSQQKQELKPQIRSQSQQNNPLNHLAPTELKKDQILIHDPEPMIDEKLHKEQALPNLQENLSKQDQSIQIDQSSNVGGENGPKEIQTTQNVQIDKCDEQISNEEMKQDESLKNPQSEQSLESSSQEDDDEDVDQSNVPPEKIKKIKKREKKLRKQVSPQVNNQNEVRQEIEIQ